ncbi:MAG TPA: hypothetical protein VF473_01610 [Cyclobacteriaceae bacterium]
MADQLIHFGKLSLLYSDGFVRYIRAGEIEIIRNIYFALRDNNWATASIVRSDERISVTPKNFEIAYTATNVVDGEEVFRWYVKILGSENGEIDFAVDGECLAPFNRNRAGICVLHPIRETKNKPLHITRPDGSVYESRFPALISPHQPFFDIRKMRWPLSDSVWAELQFEGDVFETEDQRNWADASYKTYGTPLSIPYPVMLKPGDKINQRVKLSLINGDKLPASDLAEDIEVTIDESKSNVFPKVENDPTSIIHLVLKSADDWDQFASIRQPEIKTLAISPADRKANFGELLKIVLPKARKSFPDTEIGAGFTTYFTELNRNRFDYSDVDFVFYPVTPQAHLVDLHTVIENIPAQKDQLESAKALAPGKKIHVGPVTLHDVPDRIAAGWMFGSIKYLAEGGADLVTMFDNGALVPLTKLKPKRVISSSCNEPMIISSLVIESESDQRHLILVNHTASGKSVTVRDELYTLSEYEIRFIELK